MRSLAISTFLLALMACGGTQQPEPQPDETSTPLRPAAGDEVGGEEIAAVQAELDAITAMEMQAWEAEVKRVLIAHYDANASGEVDSQAEVDRIACEVWVAIDEGHRQRTSEDESVRDAYGFAPGRFWLEVLGIDRSQRERLRVTLLDCNIR